MMKKFMVSTMIFIAVMGFAFSQEETKVQRTIVEVSGGMIPGNFAVEGLALENPFGPDFYVSVSHVAENSFTWNARLMAGISPLMGDDYKDYALTGGYDIFSNAPVHFSFGFGIGYSPVISSKRTISFLISGMAFNSSYSYDHKADSESSASSSPNTHSYNVNTNTSVFMVGPQLQYVRTFGKHFSLYVDSSVMYAMSGYFHYEIKDSTLSTDIKNTVGVSGGLMYPISFGLAWKF